MTETEMRDLQAPHPKTWPELQDFCESLFAENDDYGKAVYCMSLAATAMFNFAASRVGASGFQASCADLDILRRTRHMEHGFQVVDYGNALFPQYLESNPVLALLFDEIAPHLGKAAQALLDSRHELTHPDVIAHWRRIVAIAEANGVTNGS